eukprot:gene19729-26421_t
MTVGTQTFGSAWQRAPFAWRNLNGPVAGLRPAPRCHRLAVGKVTMFRTVLRKFSSSAAQARTPLDNSTYSLAYRVGVLERLLGPTQPKSVVDRIVDVEKMLLDVEKVSGQNQQKLTELRGSVKTLNENVEVGNANVERVVLACAGAHKLIARRLAPPRLREMCRVPKRFGIGDEFCSGLH